LHVTVTLYDAAGADRAIDLDEVDVDKLKDKDLLWIDAVAPDERTLKRLQEILSVPLSAVTEPAPDQRPILENHGSHFRFPSTRLQDTPVQTRIATRRPPWSKRTAVHGRWPGAYE